jgi:hypothetical protein
VLYLEEEVDEDPPPTPTLFLNFCTNPGVENVITLLDSVFVDAERLGCPGAAVGVAMGVGVGVCEVPVPGVGGGSFVVVLVGVVNVNAGLLFFFSPLPISSSSSSSPPTPTPAPFDRLVSLGIETPSPTESLPFDLDLNQAITFFALLVLAAFPFSPAPFSALAPPKLAALEFFTSPFEFTLTLLLLLLLDPPGPEEGEGVRTAGGASEAALAFAALLGNAGEGICCSEGSVPALFFPDRPRIVRDIGSTITVNVFLLDFLPVPLVFALLVSFSLFSFPSEILSGLALTTNEAALAPAPAAGAGVAVGLNASVLVPPPPFPLLPLPPKSLPKPNLSTLDLPFLCP